MSFVYQRQQQLLQLTRVLKAEALKAWEVTEVEGKSFVCKRDFSSHERKAAAKTGEAMDDGSFPIGNAEDLHHAISLVGFASNESEAKAHIIRRAKALKLDAELPKNWGGKNKSKKKP